MRMSAFLASTVLATVVGVSAASAAPITFTWNPSGAGLSNAGAFSADNMNVADYATITLPSLPTAGSPTVSGISESGWLVVTSFQDTTGNPGFVNGTGLGAGGAIGGANPYQLYFQFTSSSHLTLQSDGSLKGAFDSLSYTLFGDAGGTCKFSVSGPACLAGDTILTLATGHLFAGGTNTASIIDGIPGASVDVTAAKGANAGTFFQNPSDLSTILFETAFINTPGRITTSADGKTITINGGGGNVDVIVPEPVTLSIFGAGLVGAAALRRRKAKKA